MAVFRPFEAIRPTAEYASKVAALPYDVMNSDEAREMVKDNPYSFLHVDKAEIDLDPSVDLYDEKVYAKAAENLQKLQDDGICVREAKPCFYIYRQIMGERSQAGIVGCASIDDYINNVIKKHELTRADKEADRIHHVDTCNANTGPIFLTFRSGGDIVSRMNAWMDGHDPLYDFTSETVSGIRYGRSTARKRFPGCRIISEMYRPSTLPTAITVRHPLSRSASAGAGRSRIMTAPRNSIIFWRFFSRAKSFPSWTTTVS